MNYSLILTFMNYKSCLVGTLTRTFSIDETGSVSDFVAAETINIIWKIKMILNFKFDLKCIQFLD